MEFLIIFIYGLLIGSFLNVCIYRIPKGQSLIRPRSHCTNCNNTLKWQDLIPVISYVAIGGKCRVCKTKISPLYLFIEIITALLFTQVYRIFGYNLYLFKYCIFISFLIVVAMIDLKTSDVYFSTTLSSIICGLAFALLEQYIYGHNFGTYIMGGLIAAGIILIIVKLTGGMGEGDIEIAALSGIFLGGKLALLMIFFSLVIGGLIGATLIILKIKTKDDYVPLGPSFALASLVTLFFGNKIIEAYINLFFIH